MDFALKWASNRSLVSAFSHIHASHPANLLKVWPAFQLFYLYLLQDQNAGKLFADEAAAIYERAITTLLKNNMLLYFAYADFEEVWSKILIS